jgi:hypothetical protein
MIALVLALLCAQSPEPTREERVLELVERIRPAWYTQYGNARFQAQPAPLGDGTVFLPRFGVHCANSDDGTFDDGRARALARELFAIYGLETVRDVPLHDGERAAVVDGIAYPSKLGFELRGQGVSEMRGVARPEPDETALDARDHAWIAAQGFRLHVADVDDHRQVAGDGFTATLAYLAGLVHFLDAATAGEDVDLGGLLFEREGTWAWPVDEAVAGCADARVTDRRGRSLDLTVVRPCTLAFASTTAAWGPPEPAVFLAEPEELLPLRGSTRGAPAVIRFDVVADPLPTASRMPEVRLRVRQGARVRESAALTVFLTRDFDLAEPFEVELELAPGRYLVQGPARLGAARLDGRHESAPAPR